MADHYQSGVPEQLKELSDCLHPPSRSILGESDWWSPPYTINLIAAVQEILAWTNDSREFSAKHKQPWFSVLADYAYARKVTLAVNVKNFPALPAVDAAVSAVKAAIPDATEKVPIDSVLLDALRTAIDDLLIQFLRPESLGYAYDDVLRVTKNEAISSNRLHVGRDFFWRLVEFQGIDPRDLSSILLGILGDDLFDVQRAQRAIDEQAATPDVRNHNTDANLSIAKRTELCRLFIVSAQGEKHHVAWLAFENASLNEIVRKIGPVSFYAGGLVNGVVASDSTNEQLKHLPIELLSERTALSDVLIENPADVVYARIDLGIGRYSDSIRTARRVAQSVLMLTGFGVNAANWVLCEGFVQIVNAERIWRSQFRRRNDSVRAYSAADSTPAALDEVASKLRSNFSTSMMASDDWKRVLELLEWRQHSKSSAPLAQVLLDVRSVETIASWIGETKWYEYLERYYKVSWIRTAIGSELTEAGTLMLMPEWHLGDEQRSSFQDLKSRVISSAGHGVIKYDVAEVLNSLNDLSVLAAPRSRARREINTLIARTANLKAFHKWRKELEDSWTRALNRTQRVRNSLAHGGPVDETTAISVSKFIRNLSSWSVWIALEATMAEEELTVAHDSWKVRNDKWQSSVDSAGSVAKALFPNL